MRSHKESRTQLFWSFLSLAELWVGICGCRNSLDKREAQVEQSLVHGAWCVAALTDISASPTQPPSFIMGYKGTPYMDLHVPMQPNRGTRRTLSVLRYLWACGLEARHSFWSIHTSIIAPYILGVPIKSTLNQALRIHFMQIHILHRSMREVINRTDPINTEIWLLKYNTPPV